MEINDIDCKSIIKNIHNELIHYVHNNCIKSFVIGVSGGIDSALCCAIAEPICKATNTQLIGRSLPIETSKDEIDRANLVGKAFCDDFKECYLDKFTEVMLTLPTIEGKTDDEFKEKVRLANIKARIRMIYLYDLAQKTKGIVLSTDNFTEFLLGFWTLHGDVGDYGMLQNLWKTEIYQLSHYEAKYLMPFKAEALQVCIDAVPTDGLGITNSDFEQLGADSYDEIDKILQDYLLAVADHDESTVYRLTKLNDCYSRVITRHLNTKFKRNNPYNIPRKVLFQ